MRRYDRPHLAVTTAALAALLFAGCSAPQNNDQASDTEAISNRPQQYDRFIAVLRLKQPSLLSQAKLVNGQVVVDQTLKAAILAEQEQAIADLQARSPQIKILSRYRLVLNGLAIVAPTSLKGEFAALDSVSYVEGSQVFGRAIVDRAGSSPVPHGLQDANSSTHIGARKVADQLAFNGTGMRIGIIDTGIDYTHKMFGGAGTRAAYTANDPKVVESGSFPTAKVKGGIDFVGATYDAGSPRFDDHIPKPDNDPLDVQGHGSHVAGTAAGRGDDTNTHDGVAPAAELYALKVFSDVDYGSTSDHVVISAFEWAADPNGDLDPKDHLDVVNLSLGSNFGTQHVLYEEALGALATGGNVITVCSAGNSGDNAFIVGSPSTAPESISVAASVDHAVGGDALADTLTSFSSRGPRSIDGLFKPEVAAPGSKILSAAVGQGAAGARMSGTSMAAPHVTGMMALLRQAHPTWTTAELKSAAVNTAKVMKDTNGKVYPLARQGAGRVQAFEAATTTLTAIPSTISLGVTRSRTATSRNATVELANRGTEALTLKATYTGSTGLAISGPETVSLNAGQKKSLAVAFQIDPAALAEGQDTLEALVSLSKTDGTVVARIPVLALAQRPSSVAIDDQASGAGSTTVDVINGAAAAGDVQAFVSLGTDAPLAPAPGSTNPFRDDACDVESAGYRVVTKRVNGVDKDMVQIAVNLHKPISTWHLCELSVQIDKQGDGKPEQELLGTFLSTLSDGFADGDARFYSLLMDWAKMVEQRKKYEQTYDPMVTPSLDYLAPAMKGNRPFAGTLHGTFALVEADLAVVDKATDGSFYVKVATLALAGTGPANDDFLGEGGGFWVKVKPAAGKLGADAEKKLAAQQSATLTLGAAASDLVLYFPQNDGSGGSPRVKHLGD